MVGFMELRHLRYFVTVAEEENVSRAALRLHVSQPSLSRQIRDLEDELGFLLLERTAKSIRLTEAGRTFLTESREVLRRVEKAVAAARRVASGQSSEIHVGYSPMPTVKFLPQTIREFQRQLPQVKIILHDLDTEEMLGGMRSGKLQLAFLVKPLQPMLRGLKFEELARDEFRVAMSPKHPLASRRSIKPKELKSEKFISYSREEYPEYHSYLNQIFEADGIHPNIVEEHLGGVSLITALEAGSGIAILPQNLELTTGVRIKLVPISPSPSPIIIGAAYLASQQNVAAARLLQCAREAAK
jgi:DNA-binding transcriptional LysR family regulator